MALVVGNAQYAHEAQLDNPGNDARAVGAALKRISFDDVDVVLDADLIAMQSALARFARKADAADLALIYYSGHGIEVDGKNYLIPISAKLTDAGDADFEAVALDQALLAADRAGKVKIVVLDACRNNPFRMRMVRGQRPGKRSVGRGLAPVAAANGMLVAYAARAGSEADDGAPGGNSPFTTAFLKFVESPRVDVRLMLGRVRDEVVRATGRQEPFTYGSLGGEEVFLNAAGGAAGPAPRPQADEAAERAWVLVKNSADVQMIEAFRKQYGATNLLYDRLAEFRVEQLKQDSEAKQHQRLALLQKQQEDESKRGEAKPKAEEGPARRDPAPSAAAEQFIPILSYRTGPYAANGAPYANGMVDYYNLVNERNGGINGIRILFEECETGYATDKGVACYERLKAKGFTGAAFFNPQSTGITYALTERTLADNIPLITTGYGRPDSKNGAVYMWNFPLLGSAWSAADIAIQHIAKEIGGADKLKGRRISLVYHDSPYGRDPIPALQALAKKHGFDLAPVPVTHPGIEQRSHWLSIRQNRPDYVLLWGWSVMNSVAIKEAAAVDYPRDKMIGWWWSGAEPDVMPAGSDAVGYKALMLQDGAQTAAVHAQIKKHLYDQGRGATTWGEVGAVLYNRGLVNAMLGVEAVRTAQGKFGHRPLTGEQVRWGLENLNLTAARIKALGFEGMMRPIRTTCADHEGARDGRVMQWDGKAWAIISDWYTADREITDPLVKSVSTSYAAEKRITPRDCSKGS